jgi:hypothetical protein
VSSRSTKGVKTPTPGKLHDMTVRVLPADEELDLAARVP